MLKPVLFALALVAAPALPAAAQTAPAAQAQPTAADFAKNMQGAVGQTFEGGITLKAIAAEGNTLVLTVDGPAGWRTQLTPADISTALVGGFCGTAPQFFTTGVSMRVDSLDGGKLLKGPVVTQCPPAAPAQ
ncbi:hypothetical protein P6144_11780 [Sphingomonas sp. HITSZ_GF]|uniref:hypothetical protein n=1 Tax=Sphingomonas sp. HITSZ_GF TaxID=3037247 RepID=UPI00240E8102|nr:hypothetical protein [Sphingomonas sp. HITSZ_GF]MDG2534332.1 hypothetical protein [Sphingomonas sp. HITSZ_GF]